MSEPDTPQQSSQILSQNEDGKIRAQYQFENQDAWLTHALLAELFQKEVLTIINLRSSSFAKQGWQQGANIRKFQMACRKVSPMSQSTCRIQRDCLNAQPPLSACASKIEGEP